MDSDVRENLVVALLEYGTVYWSLIVVLMWDSSRTSLTEYY